MMFKSYIKVYICDGPGCGSAGCDGLGCGSAGCDGSGCWSAGCGASKIETNVSNIISSINKGNN